MSRGNGRLEAPGRRLEEFVLFYSLPFDAAQGREALERQSTIYSLQAGVHSNSCTIPLISPRPVSAYIRAIRGRLLPHSLCVIRVPIRGSSRSQW